MLQDAVYSATRESLFSKRESPQIANVKFDGKDTTSFIGLGFIDELGARIQPDDETAGCNRFGHSINVVAQTTACIQNALARAQFEQLIRLSLISPEVGKGIEKRQTV